MLKSDSQITTVTFLHFDAGSRWWMFRQMGKAGFQLKRVKGLDFFRLMGSGAENGFSIRPDFSTYVLLGVWKNQEAAHHFFQSHNVSSAFYAHSKRYWTTFLTNLKSNGQWSGKQPFQVSPASGSSIYVALTRAIIKPHRVFQFWNNVPRVSDDLSGREGLIYSKGIGEFPVFMQATLSFWESREAMVRYAYRSSLHAGVIAKARRLGWYSEELFAGFRPFYAEGNFDHPLSGFFY